MSDANYSDSDDSSFHSIPSLSDDSSSTSSNDPSMPSLVARDNSSSDDDSEMPRLLVRGANSSSDDSSEVHFLHDADNERSSSDSSGIFGSSDSGDNSMPPLVARYNSSSSDDDSEIPPLLERSVQFLHHGSSSSDSSEGSSGGGGRDRREDINEWLSLLTAWRDIEKRRTVGTLTEDEMGKLPLVRYNMSDIETVSRRWRSDQAVENAEEEEGGGDEKKERKAAVAEDGEEGTSEGLRNTSSIFLRNAYAYTSCSICIDDFKQGEELVLLPHCGHFYHPQCISPWLTEKSSDCPLCRISVKHNVRQSQQSQSQSQLQQQQERFEL